MAIELRILSGARAGQSQTFEKAVIAIGRHPLSDLRFDVTRDLDVSTTHGEIRAIDGRYVIRDQNSTNGTFVNRERLPAGGSRELNDGDVIGFGEAGPSASVRIIGSELTAPAGSTSSANPASDQPAAQPPPRRPTHVRVAEAVEVQTRWLRIGVVASVVVLGGLAAGVYYMGHRDAAARDEEIRKLVASNEQATKEFEVRLAGMNDTVLTNALRRSTDSLARVVREARGAQQSAAALEQLQRNREMQKRLTNLDMPAVRDANDPAIVLIVSEIAGQPYEATGFSVSGSGVIVTNRHVVADSTGRASRIGVKFANTGKWHRAHIVKLADGDVDLALIQVDDRGVYPAVRGVASGLDTEVGGTSLTLGFPEGTDLPMEGVGNDLVAKTTLTPGVISKSVKGLLQINSFATHGSSGSPVFDAHGHVVGVVWGGPPGPPSPIVFAVPAAQIAELIKSVK